MGTVYLAHDPQLDRDVALKLLPPEAVADSERRRRFEQEAQAASALNDPAIVTVYDFGTLDDQPFISMDRRAHRVPVGPVLVWSRVLRDADGATRVRRHKRRGRDVRRHVPRSCSARVD